jgi:hypothetical protein
MIKNLIDLLQVNDFIGYTDRIDFAKGKHAIPTTFKGVIKNIKRRIWPKKQSK